MPSPSPSPQPIARVNPDEWVEAHGDALFRYACMRVRKREAAEDLVQETLLAAWRSRDSYAGRAAERSWLLGIMKKKIADYFRRQERTEELVDMDALAALEQSQFETGGLLGTHWSRAGAPQAWRRPSAGLEADEFWSVVRECTGKLPPKVASVFLMRETEEMETAEICSTLQITQSHLFVLLHRARLALRRCLELNWFKGKTARVRQQSR